MRSCVTGCAISARISRVAICTTNSGGYGFGGRGWMSRGWTLFLLGWALVLGGGFLAHKIQTSGGIRMEDVRFTGTGGTVMSGLLYVPPNATPKHPAPGILTVHGYINSRETQDGFAIALARAGYVVLAIDQTR